MKMMPGQAPYTPEQEARLQEMLADACEAEELFDLDELERTTPIPRRKNHDRQDDRI